jgi:hypothetical protein
MNGPHPGAAFVLCCLAGVVAGVCLQLGVCLVRGTGPRLSVRGVGWSAVVSVLVVSAAMTPPPAPVVDLHVQQGDGTSIGEPWSTK